MNLMDKIQYMWCSNNTVVSSAVHLFCLSLSDLLSAVFPWNSLTHSFIILKRLQKKYSTEVAYYRMLEPLTT